MDAQKQEMIETIQVETDFPLPQEDMQALSSFQLQLIYFKALNARIHGLEFNIYKYIINEINRQKEKDYERRRKKGAI